MATENALQLSDLECWILETIDNSGGWYPDLWFPVVQREVLNFGDDASDEEVYAAFSGLVRKGALRKEGRTNWGDIPEWKPTADALANAQAVLRSKFGWPREHRRHSEKPDDPG